MKKSTRSNKFSGPRVPQKGDEEQSVPQAVTKISPTSTGPPVINPYGHPNIMVSMKHSLRFCEEHLKSDFPEIFSAIKLVLIHKMVNSDDNNNNNNNNNNSNINISSNDLKIHNQLSNHSIKLDIDFLAEEPASVVAKRLTLMERDLYLSIPNEEYYADLWIYEDLEYKTPNIDRFKQHSEMITRTVIKEVTSASPDGDERIKRISRFIEIASELTLIKNFNGAYEILHAIDQLIGTKSGKKELWDNLPPAALSIYSQLIYKYSSADNYKSIILIDFTNIIQSSSEYIGNIEDKIIEFDRYWRLWQLISDYHRCSENYQIDDIF
ncbi:hypothetical protein PPL_05046 [Heterostelium album PN500]|uniref:Ras-GEF domain-containing protein n=1 Tax=Heterostelium pallidum (strain ATCC 26659 / Pp 5 / PN500) TaxID=670386 RepID=D3B9A2_HETP5|nr:hypothetical protein PPL_05046 [Heterostelium album PN500]EFA81814.1 hypothetical protein PPL_05046 [Heterostelium album PN500]|eukprot:XP_020433931.1 hypothetical protein PPL_05046 [Heterostelium album PN500]